VFLRCRILCARGAELDSVRTERPVAGEIPLRLDLVVTAAAELDVVDRRVAARFVRLAVMELDEGTLAAAVPTPVR
jgi:hypothetical protein